MSGGGLPVTRNRTTWPLAGGAIAIQPGWFAGHGKALIYINIGVGNDGPDGGPVNMSFPMLPVFQIEGPTNDPYPGQFCLPQVPVPRSLGLKIGDQATIQVVETLRHGAALYNVSRNFSTLPLPLLLNKITGHGKRLC